MGFGKNISIKIWDEIKIVAHDIKDLEVSKMRGQKIFYKNFSSDPTSLFLFLEIL